MFDHVFFGEFETGTVEALNEEAKFVVFEAGSSAKGRFGRVDMLLERLDQEWV